MKEERKGSLVPTSTQFTRARSFVVLCSRSSTVTWHLCHRTRGVSKFADQLEGSFILLLRVLQPT